LKLTVTNSERDTIKVNKWYPWISPGKGPILPSYCSVKYEIWMSLCFASQVNFALLFSIHYTLAHARIPP